MNSVRAMTRWPEYGATVALQLAEPPWDVHSLSAQAANLMNRMQSMISLVFLHDARDNGV
jgi:hypothetical protein